MKISDTISVNPSKSTLGHVETASSSILRSPVATGSSHACVDIYKVLFPTSLSGSAEYRKYEVPLRTVFSTILIVTGLNLLISASVIGMTAGLAICTLCFGAFLALGLFTRPLMLGAAVFYCICGALSLRAGAADMTVFSLMFGCIIFAITGSGKYSCDTLIRKAILRHKRNTEKRRKEELMGYKAFHQMKY